MMNLLGSLNASASALALALTATALTSQDLAPGRNLGADLVARDLSIDRSTLYFTEREQEMWVHGATYKARFTPAGFRYVPFLGPGAPRNFPVDFSLREARIGDEPLELTEAAKVTREGNRFVLERGAVDVVYDVEVARIEQSFVIDAAGETRDLCVVLDITTDLVGTSAGAGHQFAGEHGAVLYGEAYVLDGMGRCEAISAVLRESAMSLVVPASFLARAEGMVIIDPVISTYAVDATAGIQRDVEVTYDLTSDQFLYVYEDVFSAADTDIFATAVQAGSGAFVASDYYDSSDDNYENPSVANHNFRDVSLCVAQRSNFAPLGDLIAGRVWDHTQPGFGPISIYASVGNFYVNDPDVGGNSSAQPGGRFCVVYHRDYLSDQDVVYQLVAAGGAAANQTGFLEFGVPSDSRNASISESAGDPAGVDRWQVAWADRATSNQGYRLRTATIGGNGDVIGGPATLKSVSSPDRIREVHVSDSIQIGSGSLPTYAVVYDVDSAGDEDTFVTIGQGSFVLTETELQRSEHAGLRPDQSEARVAATGSRFVVSYIEGLAAAGYRALVTSFDLTAGSHIAIAERRTDLGLVVPPGSDYHGGGALALASKFSGGDYLSQAVGIGIDRVSPTGSDIEAAIFDASNPESPAHQYCYGQRNSTGDRGFIRMEGDGQIQTAKVLRASSLPPGAFGYVALIRFDPADRAIEDDWGGGA